MIETRLLRWAGDIRSRRALYIAALIPSILVTSLFILVILAHGLRNPMDKPAKLPLSIKIRALVDLIPTLLLILLVLGSIPLFEGLAVVLPWLGYATWHLYTKLVDRSAIRVRGD